VPEIEILKHTFGALQDRSVARKKTVYRSPLRVDRNSTKPEKEPDLFIKIHLRAYS